MFKMPIDNLFRARGVWLRVLVVWALACTFPFFDEVKQYDLRFGIRGTQETAKQIVIVQFDQEDWTAWHGPNNNLLRGLKEFSVVTDSYFWNARTWNALLAKILAQKPDVVGVTFFFNPQLPKPDDNLRSLNDPRVVWAGQLDSDGRVAQPLMASSYGANVALVDLREDEDRVLRRFSAPGGTIPHMAVKLAEPRKPGAAQELNASLSDPRIINFRGKRGVFPTVHALDVLQNRIPPQFFKDKIVVIGTNSVESHQYQTPLGTMGRADVTAQIVDNVIAKRWIQMLSIPACWLYLLVILLLAVAVLVNYPQSMAFVFLLWLCLGTTAFSIWVFDSHYFWIPALSPLVLALIAYVIFIGYQLSMKENQTWRLEQEKQLLSELDQLRNNFVSLISHDLKTPIAKIQAICDRLLSGGVSEEVRDGLGSLRKESSELHRYIQSILQVSRLESSQVQVRKEATDLNEVVEKVVGQLKALADDKRQEMTVDLEPMFSIEVDGILIQEVVMNLVENAIKYTPNDGKIEVHTQEVDDKVIFDVRDNGPGVPPEDREHLFEKFFRGHAHKSAIKGTGLGLFLVKYFIELHGGEVFLETDVGKGTRVGFTLPLQA
jgi:signal transduction histidine kinase